MHCVRAGSLSLACCTTATREGNKRQNLQPLRTSRNSPLLAATIATGGESEQPTTERTSQATSHLTTNLTYPLAEPIPSVCQRLQTSLKGLCFRLFIQQAVHMPH